MRICIAIPSCPDHLDRELAIRNTWGRDDQSVFFYDEEPCDYSSLPIKVKWIFSQLQDYDFVFKTDTDTYISIPRLLTSGFEYYDYSGWVRREYNPPYCYGPGYWVSRKSLDILISSDWSHPTDNWAEDVLVGTTLAKAGISSHNDNRYSHFTPVLPGNNQIIQHLSSRRAFKIQDMYDAHEAANGS